VSLFVQIDSYLEPDGRLRSPSPSATLPLLLSPPTADSIQPEIQTPDAPITPKVQIPSGESDACQIVNDGYTSGSKSGAPTTDATKLMDSIQHHNANSDTCLNNLVHGGSETDTDVNTTAKAKQKREIAAKKFMTMKKAEHTFLQYKIK